MGASKQIPDRDGRRDALWLGVAAGAAAPLLGALLTLARANALDPVIPRVAESPSYDLDSRRVAESDPGLEAPRGGRQELTDACWIPMRSGRLLRRYEDTGVVEEVDLTGQKRPSVERVKDPGTLVSEIESTFEPRCRDDDVVGCCFLQESTSRYVRADDKRRILKRFGARPRLAEASSIPSLLFLYVLSGALVALLTRRAPGGRILLGTTFAAVVQLLVWAGSMDWGATGAFFQPMAVGAWVAPAGALLALVLPLGVGLAVATGATVTSIVDRSSGLHRCGSCDTLTDAEERRDACATCGARRFVRPPRLGLAGMAAIATGFVFTLLVLALGRATSMFYVCSRPMDAICTLAAEQHTGLARIDFTDAVVLHDWLRYALVTVPAFFLVPFLVGRFVRESRSAALLSAPLSVVVTTVASLLFVVPELSQVSFTFVFQLHLRAFAFWLIAGGLGAALGSRLRSGAVGF
ncbi:MAG: hypothetical protein U0414_26985 [Polyangiaceae bacterium]